MTSVCSEVDSVDDDPVVDDAGVVDDGMVADTKRRCNGLRLIEIISTPPSDSPNVVFLGKSILLVEMEVENKSTSFKFESLNATVSNKISEIKLDLDKDLV